MRRWWIGICFALLAGSAVATPESCNPFTGPMRFVGDMAHDSKCTDGSIQSAVDWIASHPSACPNKIFATSEIAYTGQAVTISNTGQSISIIGQGPGTTCGTTDIIICPIGGSCPSPPSAPVVTLNGTSGHSVFHIDGHNDVTLRDLTISGGIVTGDGGGIYVNGSGSLTLDTSTVRLNQALNGAGVGVVASGGHLDVKIANNVEILLNTAQNSGGGLHIEGDTTLTMDGAQSFIGFNHALNGYGGGLSVNGPARVNIGAPGYNGIGALYFNDAQYGGAIAAFGIGDAESVNAAVVNLYTTDPQHPVRVSNNLARVAGGAFYTKGHSDQLYNNNHAYVCASNFRFDSNVAPDGALAYLGWDESLANPDVGSNLSLNTGCAISGVRCAAGVACNLIDQNIDADQNGNPTSGTLITIGKDSDLNMENVAIRNNTGGALVDTIASNYYPRNPGLLHNCLIVDNTVSGVLLNFDAYQNMSIDNCTIAGNAIGSAVMGDVSSITNSLIVQPGVSTGYPGAAQYVLASDVTHFPASPTVATVTDAKFVDAANGDYHLQAKSPAVDFGGGLGGVDLENKTRDRDLPDVANRFGPRDLGPYELQRECGADDTLFCSGFGL